jgi:hypothetical protein
MRDGVGVAVGVPREELPMGRLEIHDDSGVRRYRLASLDGEHRLRVRWPSRQAALAAGTPAASDDGPVASSEHSASSRARSASGDEQHDRGSNDRRGRTDEYAWLAVLPFVATLVGLVVGAVLGFGVFDTGSPGNVNLLPYVALVPYFLLGLAGTLWVFRDARRLAAASADWQPNPWVFVLGGATVLELVVALPVLRGELTSGLVPYLAGGYVLAGVLSSVVAGPIYVLLRRRYVEKS